MINFQKKIKDVRFYFVIENEPIYIDVKNNLLYKNKRVFLFETPIVGFEFFLNKIYINDWEGKFKIFDSQLTLIEEGVGRGFYHSSTFYLGNRIVKENETIEMLINQKNNSVYLGVLHKRISTNYSLFNYFFYIDINDSVKSIEIISTNELWSFSLKNLGVFENINGESLNHELHKFIGTWKNELLIACSGNLIISLDITNGKLIRTWQCLKGYGSTAHQGRLLNKIPTAEGFQLDKSEKILYHLAGEFYVWVELESGNIQFISLKKTLTDNFIKRFRWSTGYGEDDTHIYTIGEMDEKHFATDYIPQCLLSLNKKTMCIDWVYRFENDGINTDKPQISGNKLYQLSSSKNLYVFEKV